MEVGQWSGNGMAYDGNDENEKMGERLLACTSFPLLCPLSLSPLSFFWVWEMKIQCTKKGTAKNIYWPKDRRVWEGGGGEKENGKIKW